MLFPLYDRSVVAPNLVCRIRLTILPWVLSIVTLLAVTGCGERHPLGKVQASGTSAMAPVSPIHLIDVAASSGLTYEYPSLPRPLGTKEAFGCGCAFLDYDNDGRQDILLVTKPYPRLYHNLGNGHFQDVTHSLGLDKVVGDWRGCAVGDYDGDGFLDILLTGFHQIGLLHNAGGHRFIDVTRSAGLDPKNHGHWASSAGFMDLNGDGRLDLVLLNYVAFNPKTPDFCELMPGVTSGCPPSKYAAEFPEIWQNSGKGRFQDVSAASGIRTAHGKALVLAFADLQGNGKADFFIGNDGIPADMMQNLGGMHFRNIAIRAGLDTAEDGSAVSAMGADWADYDQSGRMGLVVTNFSSKSFQLYHNLGGWVFEHRENAVGLAAPTFEALGFGVKWADVDNDGWPDILFVNGHVYDDPGQLDHFSKFRQPMMLFHNENGKHFTDLVPSLKGDLIKPILGRGLATGDYDNDGRIDFLVVDYEGHPLLLHNLTQTANHWITLDLHGHAPNVFAYGARVTAHSGAHIWTGYVSPASSYLSSSDPRIHFGLGSVTILDRVEIAWPDGKQQVLRQVRSDRILRVSESLR